MQNPKTPKPRKIIRNLFYYADSKAPNGLLKDHYSSVIKRRLYEKSFTECLMCGGCFHTEKECGAKSWFQGKLFSGDPREISYRAAIQAENRVDHIIYGGSQKTFRRPQGVTGSGKRINRKRKEIDDYWQQHGEGFVEQMKQMDDYWQQHGDRTDIDPSPEYESAVPEGSDNIQNMTTNRGVRKRETKMKNKYLVAERKQKSKIRVPKLLGEQSWGRVEVPKLLDNKCKSLTIDDSIRLSVRSTQENSYDHELTPSIKHIKGPKPDERQFNYLGDLERKRSSMLDSQIGSTWVNSYDVGKIYGELTE